MVVEESSSNTVLKPYPSLASGIVAKECEVSALREDFRRSVFGRALSAGFCKPLLYEAARLGLEAVFKDGRGRFARDLGVKVDMVVDFGELGQY